ncbi:asparaginyl-tRNA synthetase [Anaerosphaera aminiphila DSM 21120]|uniref:Asparagine--tRNA ligase n=1 Tax=Anaerosphaera aminiphila DSM 21120 TaxID=1120995 RepID=A0A1M5SZ70_9FIRM|nr:asparagine--tRNA ligase [Anaerosphaera aminiphila]SHH43817.1 asparaginyl-tRNA synthetase [Anaerosphaera aminiphila DSM 21120]
MRLTIKEILKNSEEFLDRDVKIEGWIKTSRSSKNFGFIELTDGSSFESLQVVYDDKLTNFSEIEKYTISSSLVIQGKIVESPGANQPIELHATSIEPICISNKDYPLQKKRHTMEYLRTIAHLRPRTNTFNAVFRVRSLIAFAIHKFFQEKGFVYIHTPIITSSDAEGAGEMFRVTTLDLKNVPMENSEIDFKEDFFSKETNLTVSGQLEAEAFALAFGDVYTFGPTFRAENSNTPRHAAEFWMIEPEMAFADLEENMEVAEEMLKYIIKYVLDNAKAEMEFFNKFVDKGLFQRLENVVNSEFVKITYTESIDLLQKSGHEFKFPVEWGIDLQTEHERYLTEEIFKKPVFVTDYPKGIKAFYMKENEDGKTVAAMDLLVPGVGEIIGGSQREHRLEILEEKMKANGMELEAYDWYLDLRKYGSVVHSGFGLGFERAVMYITGVSNIRDVIPFPRTVGSAEF